MIACVMIAGAAFAAVVSGWRKRREVAPVDVVDHELWCAAGSVCTCDDDPDTRGARAWQRLRIKMYETRYARPGDPITNDAGHVVPSACLNYLSPPECTEMGWPLTKQEAARGAQ